MVEGGGDEAVGVDLGDAVIAGSSERGMLVDQREYVVDGLVMGGDRLSRLLPHLRPPDLVNRGLPGRLV